ncbi:hypothetical protein BDR07DRAFT_1411741 [Suillus spraguei]|nr:hypothetical protein BDR07DRAFT_1411741 [Suillus spraguei]
MIMPHPLWPRRTRRVLNVAQQVAVPEAQGNLDGPLQFSFEYFFQNPQKPIHIMSTSVYSLLAGLSDETTCAHARWEQLVSLTRSWRHISVRIFPRHLQDKEVAAAFDVIEQRIAKLPSAIDPPLEWWGKCTTLKQVELSTQLSEMMFSG